MSVNIFHHMCTVYTTKICVDNHNNTVQLIELIYKSSAVSNFQSRSSQKPADDIYYVQSFNAYLLTNKKTLYIDYSTNTRKSTKRLSRVEMLAVIFLIIQLREG